MKRRSTSKPSLSVSTSPPAGEAHPGPGPRTASPELTGPRASPSSSFHHRTASPSSLQSNILQDLEHFHSHSPSPSSPVPLPPLPPIRIVRSNPAPPSASASPAASPIGSPAPSPRTAALELLGEPSSSPENGGRRRSLFMPMPKNHSKKASCAGRVEETGAFESFKPQLQLRDRMASQPAQPAGVLLEGDLAMMDGGGSGALSSGVPSAAGSRSISRASSSSFLGPPHAAGPTSGSPTGGGFFHRDLPPGGEAGEEELGKGNGEPLRKTSALADFALAEPTPRVPGEQLEDPLLMMTPARETPVRYGAVIRLWVADTGAPTPSGGGGGGGGGGFVGFAARDVRRIQGQLPQSGRFNVGMNDTFFVLPPYKPGLGWHFRETYFRVEDPGPKGGPGAASSREGEPVRYGEELLLVDEEEHVMCHFRGRRYIRRKPKGTKGEMTVAFLPADGERLGQEICYGDAGLRLRLQTRRGLRTEGVVLSALKRESIDAVGGFLNCLGRGRELTFDIEHAPPRIHDVSVTATLAHGGRVYVNRTVHHRVHWGQQLAFAAPSCQGHGEREHEGCTIRVTLSNGARLKMRQEHLGGLADRVRFQQQQGREGEVWLPTSSGIPGEDVDLLVRLVPLDTLPLDPHRLFLASEPRPGSGSGGGSGSLLVGADGRRAGGAGSGHGRSWRWLLDAPALLIHGMCELLPPGPVAVFAAASLAMGQGEAAAMAVLGRTLLLLVASAAAYLGAVQLLQGLLALLRWVLPSRVAWALLGPSKPHHSGARGNAIAAASAASLAPAGSLTGAGAGASDLPASMLFDRWELAVLDWRVPAARPEDAARGVASPSPPPPPPVPPTFLEAEKGDADKARARWEKTLAWRREHDVDGALARPHPKFRLIKRLYPQAFHFRDRHGHVCFYELLGRLDVPALLRAGVGLPDLVEHVIAQQEFLWGVLQPRDEDRVLLVMDLKGVSFADVTGDVLSFAKTAVGLTSTHYPARSFRTLIVNTPSWFSVVFRIIRPMLNEDTRRKIVFLEEAAVRDGAMLDFIAPEHLPKEYGGTCEVPLGESPFEQQLLQIVQSALEKHGARFVDQKAGEAAAQQAQPGAIQEAA